MAGLATRLTRVAAAFAINERCNGDVVWRAEQLKTTALQ